MTCFAKLRFPISQKVQSARSSGWHQSTRRWKLPIVKSHQFLARTHRYCVIAENVCVLPISRGCKIPPCCARHCVKTIRPRSMPFGMESLLTWPYQTAATVPLLLSVNHYRDGRTDGRTDSDDGNRGNQPSVAFPLKRLPKKFKNCFCFFVW